MQGALYLISLLCSPRNLLSTGPSSWSSSLSTLSSRSEDNDYDNDCDSEATVDLDDPAIASSPLALSFLKETLQLRRISKDYELANSCPPEIVETHWSSTMREGSRSRMKRSAVDEENEMGENWSSGVHKRTPQEQKGDGDDDNSSLLSIRKLISSRRRSRSDIVRLLSYSRVKMNIADMLHVTGASLAECETTRV